VGPRSAMQVLAAVQVFIGSHRTHEDIPPGAWSKPAFVMSLLSKWSTSEQPDNVNDRHDSAPTMVQLGLHLDGGRYRLDLQEGLAYLDRLNRRR